MAVVSILARDFKREFNDFKDGDGDGESFD